MNKNKIWGTLEEVGEALMQGYSVTDKEMIRQQYLAQVAQYPLYKEWFDRIEALISSPTMIIEYGSGPGLLVERLKDNTYIMDYTAIEPGRIFREMTEEQDPEVDIVNSTAEEYVPPAAGIFDLAVATATYHHFSDKLKALKNIYRNLCSGGRLVIADVFLPEYEFDTDFNPVNKAEFVNSVMKYVAAQIKAMPGPTEADIEDQIRTAILDILRIEELKVCISILKTQLELAGFQEITIEMMKRNDDRVNYDHLGYYFVTAKK